jgi:hypothetical protein
MTIVMLGLDYSAGRPSGGAVAGAGFGFVARYLANGLSGRVDLTAGEVQDMHAHGVAVALVWERKLLNQPDRATEGQPAGTADAQAADAQAKAIGLPDLPIYFAIDFDIPDYNPGSADPRAKLGPVASYFDGIRSVLPAARVGVYGGYWAVKRVLDAGLAVWAWQTVAWSGGQEDPRIHLFQRIGTVTVDGVGCDVNEARQDQFGQNGANSMASVWDEQISPTGLVDKNGKQITDAAKNFLGYDDDASQAAKAAAISNGAKLDALLAHFDAAVTAEQQRDAELLAAVKSSALASVDPKLVADELATTNLPQAVVSALLAVLSKAASA